MKNLGPAEGQRTEPQPIPLERWRHRPLSLKETKQREATPGFPRLEGGGPERKLMAWDKWVRSMARLAECLLLVGFSRCLCSCSHQERGSHSAKPRARPRMRMGHSPRPDATPYLDREMSPPLPTASNHYSAWDPLNMRRHVTLFDPGPVPREGGSIYINVWRVGGEGLTEWREGGGQGSATPGILTVVGSAVSFQSCWQLLH